MQVINDKKTKFALFEYATENIGDEIQSIAARRFLPRIDYYIDRDQISRLKVSAGEAVKIIMNGWYMHNPENWPPKALGLEPLLVSMFVNQKNPDVVEAFKSKASVDFLKKHGPVGARDKATLKFFEENDIPAYFSGCVTLTLERDTSLPKEEFVLAVDLSDKLAKHLEKTTKRPVVSLSMYYDPDLPREARFYLAEYFLYLYQSAHCVVTTRLHATLPSLAFETPVLLVKEGGKFDKDRYSGLAELARTAEEEEYMKDPTLFDLDHPPENEKDYLKLRNALVEKAQAYTGYANPTHNYRTIDINDLYRQPLFLKVFGRALATTYRKLLLEGDIRWLIEVFEAEKNNEKSIIANLQARIAEQDKRINELEAFNRQILTSRSWELTAPLRFVGKKVKALLKR